MSRIGRKPIPIPEGVEVSIDGNEVQVKGPKGELKKTFHPDMKITVEDRQIVVRRPSNSKLHCSLHGLTRTLIANMIEGVSKGFEKGLEISGVGYRVQKKGNGIILQLRFTHPVEYYPPPGITLEVEGTTTIRVRGIDKQLVGQVAAEIRRISPPDPYKGKGIRYIGEELRLKPGKAGKISRK